MFTVKETSKPLTEDNVEWVVNEYAELGVRINGVCYFLYKGHSIVYNSGLKEDGTPLMVRPVGKREFGETCRPVRMLDDRTKDTLDPKDPNDGLTWGVSFDHPSGVPISNGGWEPLKPVA